MGTAQQAEEYIKKYFKEKRHIELVKRKKGERGFDFRDNESKIFVEVKGTAKKKLSDTWLLGLGLNQRNIIAFPQKYSLRQLNLKLSGLFQYE